MKIFCVECNKEIEAKTVSGSMVYPNTPKVRHDKFWMCNHCKNFVGCHKNSNKNKMRPLGVIANKELKQARMMIHNVIDPIWQQEKLKRGEVYAIISSELGYTYHTGELRSLDEARRVWKIAAELHNNYAESACVNENFTL